MLKYTKVLEAFRDYIKSKTEMKFKLEVQANNNNNTEIILEWRE